MRSWLFGLLTLFALFWGASAGLAQDKGTLHPKPLPPLADPANPRVPAKEVFGRVMTPVEAQARSIGFYSRGCLAGAKALPVDGQSWQSCACRAIACGAIRR
jgi:penicillin-insensitive murein endopeptidase